MSQYVPIASSVEYKIEAIPLQLLKIMSSYAIVIYGTGFKIDNCIYYRFLLNLIISCLACDILCVYTCSVWLVIHLLGFPRAEGPRKT